MSGVAPIEVNSLSELLDKITINTEKWRSVWYRGVHGIHKLAPKSFRGYKEKGEKYSLDQYKLRGRIYVDLEWINDPVRLICHAQHFGARTRLLDWTDSLIIALYFSFEKNDQSDVDVWAIRPDALNYCAREWRTASSKIETRLLIDGTFNAGVCLPTDERVTALSLGAQKGEIPEIEPGTSQPTPMPLLPLAFYPEYVDRRMLAQQSCFTIHGRDQRSLCATLQDCLGHARPQVLQNYRISEKNFKDFRLQVLKLGLSRSAIYDGLESVVQEINDEHDNNYR
jgi:hypothetical protein